MVNLDKQCCSFKVRIKPCIVIVLSVISLIVITVAHFNVSFESQAHQNSNYVKEPVSESRLQDRIKENIADGSRGAKAFLHDCTGNTCRWMDLLPKPDWWSSKVPVSWANHPQNMLSQNEMSCWSFKGNHVSVRLQLPYCSENIHRIEIVGQGNLPLAEIWGDSPQGSQLLGSLPASFAREGYRSNKLLGLLHQNNGISSKCWRSLRIAFLGEGTIEANICSLRIGI